VRLDDYPTPAQTSVFIGDMYIDDAYRLSLEAEHPRVPLYGYNRNTFSVVADGKVLITGNLTINYRFPGYLTQAIETHRQRVFRQTVADERYLPLGETRGLLPEHREPPPSRQWIKKKFEELRKTDKSADRLLLLANSLQAGTFRPTSQILETMFSVGAHQRPFSSQHSSPALMKSRGGGFDIQVAFGDGHGPQRVDLIRDCFITGMGKTISASAGGGDVSVSGMPIYEIYPFIARTIEHYVIEVPDGGNSFSHDGREIPITTKKNVRDYD